MRLSDRLQERGKPPEERDGSARHSSGTRGRTGAATAQRRNDDPLAKIKRRAHEELFERLGSSLYDSSVSIEELHRLVLADLDRIIEGEQIPLTSEERKRLVAAVTDDVLGFGPLEQFLLDDTVTEVMVNSLEPIYVEREGRLIETESSFLTEAQLRQVIDRMVGDVGRRIDESSPMVDARLSDGSRVNAIIPPLALDGPTLTIRKFSSGGYELDDLIRLDSLTPELAQFLAACVRGRRNILVSGGTGTGKTTLLNTLSSMIPDGERIVTIEDAAELKLCQRHVIRLESRPPNVEGKGEIRIRELLRNALRMRPDRIVIGEVRGPEALDMLQAMNTGHDGSLSTLHSNSPRDALMRLETMVLMAGFDLPLRAIREQSASALDLLVHLTRFRDGTRRVTRVCEVEGMEGDVITLTDLFVVEPSAGAPATGRGAAIRATGLRPKFADELAELGEDLPHELFQAPAGGLRSAS